MDPADHGGVQGHSAEACFCQGRAAVDGGQSRAAPGAGCSVAQQRQCDGGDGIKAQRHKERCGDGSRCACAGGTFQKDGKHHADDDHLHAAVVTDAGDGAFDLFDSAGLPEKVQDHKGTEDHQHDLKAFLDAFPDQCVVNGDVFFEGGAGHIEVCKGQQKRPQQRNGSNALSGLVEPQNANKNNDDRAECQNKI